MPVPLAPYTTPPAPYAAPPCNGAQSQLVCSGCRNLLMYPIAATSVCCAVCNAVTTVPPPGTEMAQLVCGGCHTLLMYIRGATSVQCSCCHTVNLAMEANQVAHVNCDVSIWSKICQMRCLQFCHICWENPRDDEKTLAVPVKNFSPPTLEGGNIVISLEEEEIEAEEKECTYDIIGRINYLKGEKPLPTLELLKKLSAIWDVEVRDLSYIGNGCYHVFLKNYIWQTKILSRGTVSLKPGMFRVQIWMTNFDPWSFKQKHDQVWMRIYGLPMEYRGKLSLLRIAHGAGTPLRIDENTQRRGQYSRVLVDYDCSRKPPEELLVKREKMGINFSVSVYFESLPKFCFHCNMVGHSDDICRKKHGGNANEPSRMPAEDRRSQENARRTYVEKRKNLNNADQEVSVNKNVLGGEEEVDNSTEDIRDRGVEKGREQETGNFRPRINWANLVEEEGDESAERLEFGIQHDVAVGGTAW